MYLSIYTGDKTYFESGTMVKLKNKINMGGIAGNISATHVGIIKLEYVNEEGKLGSIKGTVFYLEGFKYRLYSPQTHFRYLRYKEKHRAFMLIQWDYLQIKLTSKPKVKIEYETLTDLPILQCFNNLE